MAAVSGTDNKTYTHSAGAADTLTMTGSCVRLRVVNRDATNPLYFTFGPSHAAPATATAGSNSEFVVPPASTAEFPLRASVGFIMSTFHAAAATVHVMALKDNL